MVSTLDFGSSGVGPGLGPAREHCVVFLGKTLYSHSASLHPGVQMGTGEFNAWGSRLLTLHPGGVEIFFIALRYTNRDKLPPGALATWLICRLTLTLPSKKWPLNIHRYHDNFCLVYPFFVAVSANPFSA